jgi:hypothetical protein
LNAGAFSRRSTFSTAQRLRYLERTFGSHPTNPGGISTASKELKNMTHKIAIITGGTPGAIQADFSGGMVRDYPEINKRMAEMTTLGRAGVPDEIGPIA